MLTNCFAKCDKCGHTHQFKNRTFDETAKAIRAAGWRITKTDKGWRHYCADCVRKWQRAALKPSISARKPPVPIATPRRTWLPYADN